MNRPARHDLYAVAHKGLRAFMSHALVRVGRLDAHDAAEVAEVRAELEALLAQCQGHLALEEAVIHPALRERAPGSVDATAAEHRTHLATFDALHALLSQLGGRPEVVRTLYDALVRFAADNFEHMEHEETVLNAALWATHSDAELQGLEQRIVASLTPQQKALSMRWMLPHVTPQERVALLGGVRRTAAREVFDGLLSQVRPLLGGRDWHKLAVALGL